MNPQSGQLMSRDRVTRHYGLYQFECIDNTQIILCSTLFPIAGLRADGRSVTSSRDSVHVIGLGQFLGKAVEDVRRCSETCQQYDGASRTAPIEYLQPNAVLYRDELDVMFRWVVPPLSASGSKHYQNWDKRRNQAPSDRGNDVPQLDVHRLLHQTCAEPNCFSDRK